MYLKAFTNKTNKTKTETSIGIMSESQNTPCQQPGGAGLASKGVGSSKDSRTCVNHPRI